MNNLRDRLTLDLNAHQVAAKLLQECCARRTALLQCNIAASDVTDEIALPLQEVSDK
jgi:hypothetical protein